ncbi:MAG: protein kinase [Myxococcaceae bacterium]|nr:protein kinase [Myxococcaceae bacterium]
MSSETFGKYQLIKKLATGGMAEVWLAKQTGIEGFNRHVVLKRILPHLAADPDFIQMFLNEANIASRFNHPNIAQVYDLGERDGQYFITMEFIHGEDLGRVMRKAWSTGQWVASPLALRIVANCCEGLFYAHSRADENGKPLKVVHRDISPQNILISFDGSVKLVDFGIAKAADQRSVTKLGAIKGKFAYMAPEQAAGKSLDARTDIFAIGLVLYELLTGVRPLKRDNDLGTLQAALECAIEPPSVVAEVPSSLDDVVMNALAKKPDQRYRDARQFQMAIEEYLIGQRMVATSVQISELMDVLFAERRQEEAKLGAPNPSADSNQSIPRLDAAPVLTNPSTPSAREAQAEPSHPELGSQTRDARVVPGRSLSDDSLDMAVGDTAPPRFSREDSLVAMPLSAESLAPTEAWRVSKSEARKRTPPALGESRMPSAPPRRASRDRPLDDEPEASDPAEFKRREADRSKTPLDVPVVSADQAKANASHARAGDDRARTERLRWVIAAALAALVALVLALKLFKPPPPLLSGTPVVLSVNSLPRTSVTIIPAEKGREPLDWGETPIREREGAFVGDTVRLYSKAPRIDFEKTIEFGQPHEQIKIEKEFKQGNVVITAVPETPGLSLWQGDTKLGALGTHILTYEGKQRFKVKGGEFGREIDITVDVVGGQRLQLLLDLGSGKLSPAQ